METTASVVVPAPPDRVFAHVAVLDAYPPWMRLVHDAVPAAGDGDSGAGGETDADADGGRPPAWSVELRAQVGPFARSKRLRMVRTVCEPDRRVVFERAEIDGREHANWVLRADLEPVPDGTELTMHLAYHGSLWTGGLLERVLDEEIRRGRLELRRLLDAADSSPETAVTPDDGPV